MPNWEAFTRILLFTGKGGVGKTSLACSVAVVLADRGKRVLLVSTDPASNLDEVLETPLSSERRPVMATLAAVNLDPEAAAAAYRERMVGPYRGVLPEAALRSMEEQMSGACTVEIAAFDEFTKLLADPAATADFDHVIFDTAPTGHTLRLLQLPGAWTEFLETNSTGTSCLGPLAGLKAQEKLYRDSLAALTNPGLTTVILVTRAERASIREAERTRGELDAAGLRHVELAVNGLFVATDRNDRTAMALEARMATALTGLPPGLAALPRWEISLRPFPLIGLANLRRLWTPTETLPSLIEELARQGHGVVMTMGKGGVGKTTVAANLAIELAVRGHRVHLSTTDPAAHVADAVRGPVPGLTISRIDPVVETERYSAEVLAKAGAGLDQRGRDLLAEDLRSPCTEEIAVFQAFAAKVAEGANGFLILDTAPTGHTLLLLDAAEAYHREVSRSSGDTPEAVRELLPRLRDPEYTRVILVALPEATPVHEAARLQADLRRAGIEPWAWVVNQCFGLTGTTDPVLKAKAAREEAYIDEVRNQHAHRMALISWQEQRR
jgi:arsenite-transporting ATPase